jgi:hypothetical protein
MSDYAKLRFRKSWHAVSGWYARFGFSERMDVQELNEEKQG